MSSKFAPLQSATCPGLFVPSIAQDGLLSRLRIPGGWLTVEQCKAIAALADTGNGTVEVTNRANVQIRGLQVEVGADQLERLQTVGLASPIAAVDALRNIMASPTAGIDRQQLLDTRPLVAVWNHYLTTRPDFAVLSPKFSVCFDGGEAVSVRDRPNDISLVAAAIDDDILFRLHLNLGERGEAPCDVGVLVKPQASLQVLTAIAEVYRDYTLSIDATTQRKPRLRELLHDWGVEPFLQAVAHRLPFSLLRCERTGNRSLVDSKRGSQTSYPTPHTPHPNHQRTIVCDQQPLYHHLGIHSQRQPGFSYIGIVLPLGRLETQQLRGLTTLAANYGNGMLRLTPWQTVLLAELPTSQIVAVQQEIERLGLHTSATHPHSAIVACSGSTGCKSSATNTQENALALANHLAEHIVFDRPINIHFSGCEKSCAQYHASDIALLGVVQAGKERYHLYVGDDGSNFGRSLEQTYEFMQLPDVIQQMIQTYQRQRSHPQETFRDFVNRYPIAALKQMFGALPDCPVMGTGEQV